MKRPNISTFIRMEGSSVGALAVGNNARATSKITVHKKRSIELALSLSAPSRDPRKP